MIDLNSSFGALKRVGYDGPVVVEPFGERLRAMPTKEAVRATTEALSKVWRDAGLTKM